jgi:microcompartment protein CcmL/EutN
MTGNALGFIETIGLTAAIEAADSAVKSANVRILGYELAKGDGMATVKVEGDVGAVKAAVKAAEVAAGKVGRVVSVHVIPRPAEGTERIVRSRETVGLGEAKKTAAPRPARVPPESAQTQPETPQIPPEAPQTQPETPQIPPESVQTQPEIPQPLPEPAQPEMPHILPEAAQTQPETPQPPLESPQPEGEPRDVKKPRSQSRKPNAEGNAKPKPNGKDSESPFPDLDK